MKTRAHLAATIIAGVIASALFSAEPAATVAGEYADKSFLQGKGVFQLSLEQNGKDVSIFFSAAHNDGHGAAPEADGKGSVTSKGTVEFKWEDNFKNLGTGTIKRAGDDVIVSIKTSRVADVRCLEFYKENMRLKRAVKKYKVEAASSRLKATGMSLLH